MVDQRAGRQVSCSARALVEIFQDTDLASDVALRGGTALQQAPLSPARRYLEDMTLCQLGPRAHRRTVDRTPCEARRLAWEAKRERGGGFRLIYRFESENPPVVVAFENRDQHERAPRRPWHDQRRLPSSLAGGRRADITDVREVSKRFWPPKLGGALPAEEGDAIFSTCGPRSKRVSIPPPVVEIFAFT